MADTSGRRPKEVESCGQREGSHLKFTLLDVWSIHISFEMCALAANIFPPKRCSTFLWCFNLFHLSFNLNRLSRRSIVFRSRFLFISFQSFENNLPSLIFLFDPFSIIWKSISIQIDMTTTPRGGAVILFCCNFNKVLPKGSKCYK